MELIYFVVVWIATTAGALTGMGGGVIIKPVLDVIGEYDAATIGVLCSCTVFTMSIVSIHKQVRQKAKIDLSIALPLSAGSILGGWSGERLLRYIVAGQDNARVVITQNSLLGLLLLGVYLYMKHKDHLPTLHAKGVLAGLVTGLLAGMASTFLGIGGGPINVAALIFVFSMDTKAAAVNSILTIFFAQLSKLGTVLLHGGFSGYDLHVLPLMLVAAVIGGWSGAKWNRQMTQKQVEQAFNLVQLAVFAICLYNIASTLTGM